MDNYESLFSQIEETTKVIDKSAVQRAIIKYQLFTASVPLTKPFVFSDTNVKKTQRIIRYGMLLCIVGLLNQKTIRMTKDSKRASFFEPSISEIWKLITKQDVNDSEIELYYDLVVMNDFTKSKEKYITRLPPYGDYSSHISIRMSSTDDYSPEHHLYLELRPVYEEEETSNIWGCNYFVSEEDDEENTTQTEYLTNILQSVMTNQYELIKKHYGDMFTKINPVLWPRLDERLMKYTE